MLLKGCLGRCGVDSWIWCFAMCSNKLPTPSLLHSQYTIIVNLKKNRSMFFHQFFIVKRSQIIVNLKKTGQCFSPVLHSKKIPNVCGRTPPSLPWQPVFNCFHLLKSMEVLANLCQRSSDTQEKAQTQAAATAWQFIALPARSSTSLGIVAETPSIKWLNPHWWWVKLQTKLHIKT